MEYQEKLDLVYQSLQKMKDRRNLQFLTLVEEVWSGLNANGLADSSFDLRHDQISTTVRQIFWDLFRRNIITLGSSSGSEFPWFEVTDYGKAVLDKREYYTQDVQAYISKVKSEAPNLDPLSELYLKEAIQCFDSECYLAASVMIGVACENEFFILIDAALASSYKTQFTKTDQEKWITKKIERFNQAIKSLESDIKSVDPSILIDLQIQLIAALTMIKNARNDSGHPTGNNKDRGDVYALLILLAPCIKKIHHLKTFF